MLLIFLVGDRRVRWSNWVSRDWFALAWTG